VPRERGAQHLGDDLTQCHLRHGPDIDDRAAVVIEVLSVGRPSACGAGLCPILHIVVASQVVEQSLDVDFVC
jgi:hypothetical protein